MATNTFGTTNTKLLASMMLSTLVTEVPMFRDISTDFSAGTAKFGQAVNVKLATKAPVQAYDKSAGGYVAQNSAKSEIDITLDQHIHITREVDIEEVHTTDLELLRSYAEIDAAAIAEDVMADMLGKVLVADVTNGLPFAVGAFDHGAMVDLNTAMTNRKVTKVGRFALLNPSYGGALKKDTVVTSSDFNGGGSPAASGLIGTVDGVRAHEYTEVPTNSEDLVGLLGVKESFGILTRLPLLSELGQSSSIPINANQFVVTDQNSGLSIYVVEHVDVNLGVATRSYRLMYGTGIGNAATIQRITSV